MGTDFSWHIFPQFYRWIFSLRFFETHPNNFKADGPMNACIAEIPQGRTMD